MIWPTSWAPDQFKRLIAVMTWLRTIYLGEAQTYFIGWTSGALATCHDKMPFDIPYGAPISMNAAKKLVEASIAEATKRGWKMAVAVVSPGGDLVYFAKMGLGRYRTQEGADCCEVPP
jgi:hypothetical protein